MANPVTISDTPLIKPVTLARWIFNKEEIWQQRVIEPMAFAQVSSERGIRITDRTVIQLWQLGLLRADLIVTTQKLYKAGLVLIGKIEPDEYAYADNRAYRLYPAGLGATASDLKAIDLSLKLFFHPFRFCVLWDYERVCRFVPRPSPLTTSSGCARLLKRFEEDQKRLGSERVIARFARANSIASLAVACEPCAYPVSIT